MRRVLAIFLVSAIAAFCQTSTSSISGIVTDSSGAVVPGASVVLINEETGIQNHQTTTDSGLYSFPALPVGTYTVKAELRGFKTSQRSKNTLIVNTPLQVDLTLEVGEAADVVNVEATAEQLQTSNASIGNVVSQKAIVDLPLNGRNPLALLVLEPGVVQRSKGSAGTGVHVNGSRDLSSNVTIDGIEANESSVPNAMNNVYRLNPDNTQEYKVTTSNATAEEGRNSGASISVATRSGTNSFHGTVYEFFRNTVLNSNEFFANAQGTPKPDIKLNQYGFEVGGPIVKNRTFFFGSWSGQQINFAQPVDQSFGSAPLVYTASARAGIFRYFVADPANPLKIGGSAITRNGTQLVDPTTGALASGIRNCGSSTDLNCVASFNMFGNDPRRIGGDATVAALLQKIPLPNSFVGGDGLNTASYSWNPPAKVRGPSYMARIDHRFGEKDAMFGRYLQSDNNTLGGDPNNSRPQLYPGLPPMGEVFRASKNLALSYRHVFSPRVVNELTAGISRFGFLFTQGEANPDFPNVPPYARSAGTGTNSAFNNLEPGILNTPRTYRVVTTPQVLDNLSVVVRSHIIRTGFNFRFYRHNDQRGQPGGINVTPLLTFNYTIRPPSGFNTPALSTSSSPGINATDNNRLLGSINDLLGIPARLSQTFLGDLNHDTFLPYRTGNSVTLWNVGHRLKQYNMYLQDEWKVRRNLTLNYGVRWEINPPPSEAAGRVYVPDRSINGSEGPVTFMKADRWFRNMNLGAIGPRVGITWTPGHSQRTVFRTGYGIAYDTISSFQVTAVSGLVPGLTTSCAATVGGSASPGCQAVPDKRIAEGFPLELAPPSVKPSSFLTAAPQLLSLAPGAAVFDQNLKMPTVHQWNFTIQHELPGSLLAQVGYVGRRGTKLFRAYDINQINADPILPSFLAMQQNVTAGCQADGTRCPAGVTAAAVPIVASGIVSPAFVTSAATQSDLRLNAAGTFAGRVEQTTLAARLRPNQQFGIITYLDNGADSYYHSMQATLHKRFGNGLALAAAYTFGKSMDTQSVDPVASSSGGGLSTTNSRTPTDIRNFRSERARSDFDRTHVLTANWIYDLPVGRGLGRAWKEVLGGWSINGIYTYMSGEPFSVRSGVRTSNNSHESRAVLIGAKPEVELQQKAGVVGPVLFADNSAFRIPAPGQNGDGRNTFTSVGYWNLDSGISKRFDITERVRLQLRTEFFNLLNHPNFDNPRDATIGGASIQAVAFGQTCCATVAPPSTQTIIQTGESSRVIQIALKLQF